MFDRLVHPLFWLFAACLPPMVSAGGGAVVVPTSATALRTSSHPIAAYEAARSAQTALVRSVGWEMASQGVRVNGVAPNFIENPSYFPPEVVADEHFRRDLQRTVPAGRLGRGDEAAATIVNGLPRRVPLTSLVRLSPWTAVGASVSQWVWDDHTAIHTWRWLVGVYWK